MKESETSSSRERERDRINEQFLTAPSRTTSHRCVVAKAMQAYMLDSRRFSEYFYQRPFNFAVCLLY